ncbi:MAG: cytochrome c family protein [Gemmatimonadota bacterium]|nr:cytochrome c family protein [Gemmatimonadota bacterium]
MKRLWLTAALGGVLILGTVAFVGGQGEQDAEAAASATTVEAASQPIQFPHNTHAGQFQIDCQYCHFSAERSVDAGIPPVESCMGCHRVVQGRNNPEEVAKVVEHYNAGTPIPWRRIYKVSDHVRFPHLRHVNAGVDCQTCHGQVQEMGVLEAVAPEARDLKMGWCISCHVEQNASRDCTVCHY